MKPQPRFPIWMALFFTACITEFDASRDAEFIDNLDHDYDGDGFTENLGDCDDTRSDVYPGAVELCDSIDNDCNEQVDDNPPDSVWYQDADRDSFGVEAFSVNECTRPEGYVAITGDCDDSNATVNPSAVEICDDVDNDCDGMLDDDDPSVLLVSGTEFFRDLDNDGYGDISISIRACDQPLDYATEAGDCNDEDAQINPTTVEITADGIDQNCDGLEECYTDADGDGFGGLNTQFTTNLSCSQGGVTTNWQDCNDSDFNIQSVENDADCDGQVTAVDCDDNNSVMPNGDADCDGVLTEDDCNDENPLMPNEDADCDGTSSTEDCDDSDALKPSQDADCDGTITANDCDDNNPLSSTVFTDGDCDGTLQADDCDDDNPISTILATDSDCDGVISAQDCDDNNPLSTTLATDADCDGVITFYDCDDNDPSSFTLYIDADCDGVVTAADCNDNDPQLLAFINDADCDGHITTADCNDNDSNSTSLAEDADCDGYVTSVDCDDSDPSDGELSGDCDQDGVDATLDCNDLNTRYGSNERDTDCDGFLDVRILATSARNSCAIDDEGFLLCWGSDETDITYPPFGEFTQLSLGGCPATTAGCSTASGAVINVAHGCAIDNGQDLECWGDGFYGQATPPLGNFTQVSNGGLYSCAIATDQSITCWGDDFYNQLSAPIGSFVKIDAGLHHSCAIATNGSLECWGDNSTQQSTPPAGTQFIEISVAEKASCALEQGGTLTCWGETSQYGTAPAATFAKIEVYDDHICAIDTVGLLHCWGDDLAGETTAPSYPSIYFSQISTSKNHSCALLSNGNTECWGNDTWGQVTHPHCDGDFDATLIVDDEDCDGLLANEDCDDNDPWSTPIAEDADCDGAITIEDCNDNNPEAFDLLNDLDCDGILFEFDCDDSASNLGAILLDQDCDGILRTVDCNDQDASIVTIQDDDSDCDGVITPEDCDDNDQTLLAFANDRDCDGFITADDCNDDNPSASDLSIDADCDGVLTNDDCNDEDPFLGAQATDTDCDSVLASEDCDDSNPEIATIQAEDNDCDGVITAEDCDDWYTDLKAFADDADCDGVVTEQDCDDNNPDTVFDMDCDGEYSPTYGGTDCDDNDASKNYLDADGDGEYSCENDCDDSDPNVYSWHAEPTYLGIGCVEDVDGDGYGSANPSNPLAEAGTDCDDQDYSILPGAYDSDCDGLTDARQVAVGPNHGCVIDMNGQAQCWGSQWSSATDPSMYANYTFTDVVSGDNYSCARDDWGGGGGVYCWGYINTSPNGSSFTAVKAGPWHACAIHQSGAVECWGDNYYGQSVSPVGGFIDIALGESFSCGISSWDNSILCWGDSTHSVLDESQIPTGNFTQIEAGSNHVCALADDKTVSCWGDNPTGATSAPVGYFNKIAAGGDATCGISVIGFPHCWGGNYGPNATYNPPSAYAADITVNGDFGCIVAQGGQYIDCWGAYPPGGYSLQPW